MTCNTCGKQHGGPCLQCPNCGRRHPPPCRRVVQQQQQPLPTFGGPQYGVFQPLGNAPHGGQQQPLPPYGNVQYGFFQPLSSAPYGALPQNLNAASPVYDRAGSHGGFRGHPSQEARPASKAPKRARKARENSGRPKTPKERKERKATSRAANKPQPEAARKRPSLQESIDLLGVLDWNTPPSTLSPHSLALWRATEESPATLTEALLIEDITIRPGCLDPQEPVQKWVIDDTAWALVKFGSAELHRQLIALAAEKQHSLIEEAIALRLFCEECGKRYVSLE